jgi:hypothetical protein
LPTSRAAGSKQCCGCPAMADPSRWRSRTDFGEKLEKQNTARLELRVRYFF